MEDVIKIQRQLIILSEMWQRTIVTNRHFIYEEIMIIVICGSHGSDYEDWSLMGCGAVNSDKYLQAFRRNVLSATSLL
jgi:hypothetical protein